MTPWEPRTTPDCMRQRSATLRTAATGTSTGRRFQTRVVRRVSRWPCPRCTSCATWPTTTWPPTTGTRSSVISNRRSSIFSLQMTAERARLISCLISLPSCCLDLLTAQFTHYVFVRWYNNCDSLAVSHIKSDQTYLPARHKMRKINTKRNSMQNNVAKTSSLKSEWQPC